MRLGGRTIAGVLALSLGALVMIGVGPKPTASKLFPSGPVPIEVEARPLRGFDLGRPERTEFGRLRYLGGLEIRSPFSGFGGLSGLAMRADGSGFDAISDAGYWLSAEITYDGPRPTGLDKARMGPMLDEAGSPLSKRRAADAEAIAPLPNGDVLVSFENRNVLRRFPLGRDGIDARGRTAPAPPALSRLRSNRGIEGLAACPDGRMVAVSEDTDEGAAKGWIWRTPADAKQVTVAVPGDFAVTDLACLDTSEILLLERRYTRFYDIAVRLRRMRLAELEGGEPGETLLEADLSFAIDNFEGLGVHRRDGRRVLTLLSDDNYSFLQRTLLLQFELLDGPAR